VNYGLRIGPDWTSGADRCKSYDRTIQELTQLKQVTDNVRVYSMVDCDMGAVLLQATQQVGMGLWMGIWVGPNQFNFVEDRARLLELLQQYDFSNVIGIHVASEAIYREDITAQEAISLRNIIKADMNNASMSTIPITVADIVDTYNVHSELITVDELAITSNMFPFWEKSVLDINGAPNWDSAAEYFAARMSFVESKAGSRQIIITETGWADAGVNNDSNIASPASMAKWMRDFVCLANSKGWQYFWFNAYDSGWRRANGLKPDDVEGRFGMFNEDGSMKQHIQNLVIDCTQGYTDIDPTGNITPEPGTHVPTPPTSTPTPITPPPSSTMAPTTPAPVTPVPTPPVTTPAPITPPPSPTMAPTTPAPVTPVPTPPVTTPAPITPPPSPTMAPTSTSLFSDIPTEALPSPTMAPITSTGPTVEPPSPTIMTSSTKAPTQASAITSTSSSAYALTSLNTLALVALLLASCRMLM
jgi:exo-beta-1,3-glucanase (GH17 family)